MKVALIDGDSLAFLCSKETAEDSLRNIDDIMAAIMKGSHCTHYILFLSKGPYFRHEVNKDYKANRKPVTLKFVSTLMAYLREEYGGVNFKGVEADDMVAMAAKDFAARKVPATLCAIDKDCIKTIPGSWYNFKEHSSGKTNAPDAVRFLYTQVLMGDTVDNIMGCGKREICVYKSGAKKGQEYLKRVGVGPKAAEIALANCEGEGAMIMECIKQFKERFGDTPTALYMFQQSFRQVYLLRDRTDFLNEVGYVPEIPEPISWAERFVDVPVDEAEEPKKEIEGQSDVF